MHNNTTTKITASYDYIQLITLNILVKKDSKVKRASGSNVLHYKVPNHKVSQQRRQEFRVDLMVQELGFQIKHFSQ